MEIVAVIIVVILVIAYLNRRSGPPASRAVIDTVPGRTRSSARGATRITRPTIRFDTARSMPDLSPEVAARGNALWKPAGVAIEVQGFSIPHGMAYLGRGLASVGGGSAEPALIDPGLASDRRRIDWVGDGLDYWPSYSHIPPGSRAAYLTWLADGRRARDVPMGYPFLFFYGLERRVLVDARHLPAAAAEVPGIRAEVEQLREAYGANHSFRSYSTSFLGVIDTLWPGAGPAVMTSHSSDRTWELPIELRVRIGRSLAAGEPLPASLAFAWLLASPEVSMRTPATRCPSEFQRLFEMRYAAAFGAGLAIRPPRKRLVAHYRPASASFGGPVELPVGDLPDVAGLTAPVTRLREVADACSDDLDAYSRWLGRHPDGGQSLAAAALLPDELIDGQGPAISELQSWLDRQLDSAQVNTIRGQDLLRHWPTASGWQPTRAESVSLAQLLGKLGIGVEPDVRFDGPVFVPSSDVVLFRLAAGDVAAPTAEYALATLVAQLGMAVAAADGTVSPMEESRLDEHLATALHLTPLERARLAAHLSWLRAATPPLSATKKRVASLGPEQREALAEFLVAVAAADGQVGPAEVASLGKMFSLLGLEPNLVFGRVHALATGETRQMGAPEGRPRGPVALDMKRVEAKLLETQAVSALLGGVFTSEDEPAPAVKVSRAEESAVAGLDGTHSAMLRALRGRDTISRPDFEAISRGLGLLPDGAIDTINDAAFDRVGHPVVEGDDPLSVDQESVEEMVA